MLESLLIIYCLTSDFLTDYHVLMYLYVVKTVYMGYCNSVLEIFLVTSETTRSCWEYSSEFRLRRCRCAVSLSSS